MSINKWCKDNGIDLDILEIIRIYDEPHRHYHNNNHILYIQNKINSDMVSGKFDDNTFYKLVVLTYYHDIVYYGDNKTNEEDSAEYFLSKCNDKFNSNVLEIYNAILDTKYHKGETELSRIFNEYDMDILNQEYEILKIYERGIRKEFGMYDREMYVKGRVDFLTSISNQFQNNETNIKKLITYVKRYTR